VDGLIQIYPGIRRKIGDGFSDYWIVKTDSMGIFNGRIQLEEVMRKRCVIEQTTDGGLYFRLGFSYSNISGDKTEELFGVTDYWILKLTVNTI
jgi:hypothetical protein